MSKPRYYERGTELWSAHPSDPLRIERSWVISRLGENFASRDYCSESHTLVPYAPDYLHETPQAAFEHRKKINVSAARREIVDLENKLRQARARLKKTLALKVENIKMPAPQTFERSEWEWSVDF